MPQTRGAKMNKIEVPPWLVCTIVGEADMYTGHFNMILYKC